MKGSRRYDIYDRERHILHGVIYIWNLKKQMKTKQKPLKITVSESRMVAIVLGSGRNRERLVKRYKFLVIA